VNILFGTNLMAWGGGEKWMLTAARAMATRGHHVSLCAPAGSELLSRARDSQATAPLETLAVDFVRDLDPVSFGRVWRHCRRRRIDVFCLNMDRVLRVGGLAARLAGVPVVIPRRGSEFPLKGHLNYRFQYQWVATALLVNSRATERTLCRGLSWRPRGRVHVLHNGLDLAPYDGTRPRAEVRAELGLSGEDTVILNVGELTTRKNAALLVSVVPSLVRDFPRLRVLLVGEGDQRETVLRQIAELEIEDHVRLLGFRRDVPDLLAASDLLAHTAHVEGFGFVVAEAMACRLPTVVTDASSLPEVIADGETGLLFGDDDGTGLELALRRYLSDVGLRRAHGEAGRRRVEQHFELSAQMAELERIFREELEVKKQ
jgi:glycosyltransferase involved in cell wall biosynthesis